MDIKSFRMLMKEYNAGLRTFEKKTDNVPAFAGRISIQITQSIEQIELLDISTVE